MHKLNENFVVSKLSGGANPVKEHQITMCLKSDWYSLECKPQIIENNHPVNSLDAEILTKFILDPLLQINDLKTDENIEFISGAVPIQEIENNIKKEKYDIAFLLYPCTMDQVKKVADNHLIMPPKSTWVEPKMRSGLTIYPINE